jgi:carboxyl-terminal processing protease
MRRNPIALLCLLAASPLSAGPAPSRDNASPVPTANREAIKKEARDYALNLLTNVEIIRGRYVRELSQTELLEAAIGGLYDAAQVPRPTDLRSRLTPPKKTDPLPSVSAPPKAETPLPPALPGLPGLPNPSSSSGPTQVPWLVERIAAIREGLGNPESLRGDRALLASLRAITRILDPYSVVMTAEEQQRADVHEQNTGTGLALADGDNVWPLVIKAVVPGSPAQKMGLRPGDAITHIDGNEAKGLAHVKALRQINGGDEGRDMMLPAVSPPGQGSESASVKLSIRPSDGGDARTVTVARESFAAETVLGVTRNPDNSWDYWLDRKKRIAHVRISTFASGTDEELREVIERLDAGKGLGGLILDLRWTPGGYLNSALGCAGVFLKNSEVARAKSRFEEDHVYNAVTRVEAFTRFPMVVLVNGETVGGAEMIAASLQDHKRAVVVGDRTRGKGSIQNYEGIASEGTPLVLKLTVATFTRPNGKALNRFVNSKARDDWGVRPDEKCECVVSPALNRQLREWWDEQTLRPGSSNKALPLDDPENDPQRQAALKALLRIMK